MTAILIALLCGPVQCTRIPDQAFPTPTACEVARQEERGRRVEGLRVEGYCARVGEGRKQ